LFPVSASGDGQSLGVAKEPANLDKLIEKNIVIYKYALIT